MLNRMMTRREQVVLLAFAASILLGAFSLYLMRTPAPAMAPSGAQVEENPSEISPPPEPTVEAASQDALPATGISQRQPDGAPDLRVAIQGAIEAPGLYDMPPGKRVQDLIDRAGGATEQADVSSINIAAHLVDGTTLTIPAKPNQPQAGRTYVIGAQAAATYNPPEYLLGGPRPGGAASTPGAAATPPGASGSMHGLIDINRASQSELEQLPGIGPAKAGQIIAYRETAPFRTIEDLENVSGIGPKTMEALRPLVTVGPR